MSINAEQVQHIADLARLDIDPAAVRKLAGQLATILEYIAKLDEVDTSGVQPMSHAIDLTNAFREDSPHDHLERAKVLDNAPASDDGSFLVPKVI